MLWWKRFGLIEEPRLDVHPLSGDDSRLFVKIQDPSVAKIFSTMDDPNLFFKKIHAILGTFGTGKTSMVNYVRYNMHLKSIKEFSMNIEWKPITDKVKGQHEIRAWFLGEMRSELLQACDMAFGATITEKAALTQLKAEITKSEFDERTILKSIAELCCFYEGLTIFLDELHKVPEYQYVLDFLKGEQSLFQSICRYPVAVFVACSDTWEKNLQMDQYSGIFDEFVHMPFWGSKYAYKLIDIRLKDASGDSNNFNNPFTPDAFDKIASIAKVRTPREWIKTIKKVIDNTPEDVKVMTSLTVSKALLLVDNSTVDQIRKIGLTECSNGYKHLQTIIESSSPDITELLNIIALLYHNPIARPLTQKTRERIGIEELPLYLETLKSMKIVVEGSQSSPPIKIGKGAVEITQRDIYRLDNNLTSYFEKIEEKFGLDPEDYILKMPEGELAVLTDVDILNEEEVHLHRIKEITEKMTSPRAKNHMARVSEDYQAFVRAAFSSSALTMPTFRSGMMSIYNLVTASAVEKTKNEDHQMSLSEDLKLLKEDLKISDDLINAITNLGIKFRDIEEKGKPLCEDVDNAKRQMVQVADELTNKISDWLSYPIEVMEEVTIEEVLQKVDELSRKISRPPSVLRTNAIHFCSNLASQRGMKTINQKWIENLFKVMKLKNIDSALTEAVDIRYTPQLYPSGKHQANKTALTKLGIAFENSLLIIGRNHINAGIRKIFKESTHLTIRFMLLKLFEDDGILKEALLKYSDFDRTTDEKDFEKKLKELIGTEGKNIPAYARTCALTSLVRNFNAHEGNSDTIAYTDDLIFDRLFDDMIFAILYLFKYSIEHKLIQQQLGRI